MRERNLVIIILAFLLFGAFIVNLTNFNHVEEYNQFNFYKSKIIFNNNEITETLYYSPDKPYHTLYRNFNSQISLENKNLTNSIFIQNVSCSSGVPYARTNFGECKLFDSNNFICPSYTENNEFGCSFGNTYGFTTNGQYLISSNYELNPENIYKINGKNYIKFVIYNKENHVKLNTNNFEVSGAIMKDSYSPKEQVIVYLPQEKEYPNANIIVKKDFEFDKVRRLNINLLIFSLLPFFLVLFTWLKYGKEIKHFDMPEERSYYPQTDRAP